PLPRTPTSGEASRASTRNSSAPSPAADPVSPQQVARSCAGPAWLMCWPHRVFCGTNSFGAIDAFPLGSAALLEVWTVARAVGDPPRRRDQRQSGQFVRDKEDDDSRKGFIRLG